MRRARQELIGGVITKGNKGYPRFTHFVAICGDFVTFREGVRPFGLLTFSTAEERAPARGEIACGAGVTHV